MNFLALIMSWNQSVIENGVLNEAHRQRDAQNTKDDEHPENTTESKLGHFQRLADPIECILTRLDAPGNYTPRNEISDDPKPREE